MKKKHLISALLLFLFSAIFLLPMSTVAVDQSEKEKISSDQVTLGGGKPAKTGTVFSGDIFWIPLEKSVCKVTAPFGPMKDPFTGKDRFHNGIDLSAKAGTPVHAAASGKIVTAVNEHTPGEGTGRYIEIRHENNFSTLYTQLDSVLVRENQNVQKGELIGLVGSSGRSTGPHLHFELRLDDQAINPEEYMQFR